MFAEFIQICSKPFHTLFILVHRETGHRFSPDKERFPMYDPWFMVIQLIFIIFQNVGYYWFEIKMFSNILLINFLKGYYLSCLRVCDG